jgi:RNA-directed DNA polymerase
VHLSESLDFLGFRIQWRRKRGTSKWYVYTFIPDRPVRSLKDNVRALTNRLSQQHPGDVLIRLNQITRGWANYFKHAVCKHTLNQLDNFVWHWVISWRMRLHRWKWTDVRRRLIGPGGRWRRPAADGIELFNIASVRVTRYRRPAWRTSTARFSASRRCHPDARMSGRGSMKALSKMRRRRLL